MKSGLHVWGSVGTAPPRDVHCWHEPVAALHDIAWTTIWSVACREFVIHNILGLFHVLFSEAKREASRFQNHTVIACLCGPQNTIQNILGCSYALTDSSSAKSLEKQQEMYS